MIKVNILTLDAVREAIPAGLQGLTAETLRNLQTELDPVPFAYANVEYWPEIHPSPDFDPLLATLGAETFDVDEQGKTVTVTRAIVPRPVVDIADALQAELQAAVDDRENAVLTSNGMSLSASDRTINRTLNATKNLGKKPTKAVRYYTGFGRVVLDLKAADVEGLHTIMMEYREAVANNEAAVMSTIVAAEALGDTPDGVAAMAAIDLSAGWPATTRT